MGSNASVGIFDSGIGGLSVLKHIRAELPAEKLRYFADSAFAPYGNKSQDFIRERAVAISEDMLLHGVKALVVACNTATVAAVAHLRERYSIPIIGMEPAVKPAVAATRSGVVGVLATVGTLASAQFAGLLESYGQDVQIITQGCPGLVERIEIGDMDSDETIALLSGYLEPLIAGGADTVVLGCTHYPFLRSSIERIVGDQVTIIDTGAAVARQLKLRLKQADLLAMGTQSNTVQIVTNSNAPDAKDVIRQLWGESADVHQIKCSVEL